MRYQILILCISSIILLETIEAGRVYDEHHQALIRKIRSYTKRQADGACLYQMCNETTGYPSEEILQVIQKRDEYKDFFGTVMEPYRKFIESRFGDGEESMCKPVPVFMLPQKAKDVSGVWQTVVNVGTEFQQIVHFEACAVDAMCKAEEYKIPGRTAYCVQNEIILKMLVFNTDQGSQDKPFKMASFPIPSGCDCKHKPL